MKNFRYFQFNILTFSHTHLFYLLSSLNRQNSFLRKKLCIIYCFYIMPNNNKLYPMHENCNFLHHTKFIYFVLGVFLWFFLHIHFPSSSSSLTVVFNVKRKSKRNPSKGRNSFQSDSTKPNKARPTNNCENLECLSR